MGCAEFLLLVMFRTRSIGRLLLQLALVAWQLWMQNITCKRLDRRRVKGIDYLGCAADLKANQLEAIFNQGYRIVFETFIFYYWTIGYSDRLLLKFIGLII